MCDMNPGKLVLMLVLMFKDAFQRQEIALTLGIFYINPRWPSAFVVMSI